MIYLIKAVYYIEETKEVLKLLKIGYTKDDPTTIRSRFGAYKLHNPRHIILYRIPNLTEHDEKAVLNKFSSFVYEDYGREWFYWDQEIIDFFENLSKDPVTTLKGLIYVSKCPGKVKINGKSNKEMKEIKHLFKIYLSIFLSSRKKSKDLFNIEGILCDLFSQGVSTLDELFNYLEFNYLEEYSIFRDKIKKLELDTELREFVFNYYKETDKNKYEMLCNKEYSSEFIKKVLDFIIPGKIKESYLILGPEKLKATGYNRTLIDKALGKVVFNKDNLEYEMLSSFKISDFLSLPEIKSIISNVYSKVGYTKAPVASDILKYFEVKESSLRKKVDGVKKRVVFYKILSVKPEFENEYNLIRGIIKKEE